MEPSLGRPELSEMDLTLHVSENLHWLCFTFGYEKVAFDNFFFLRNLTFLNANCCCIYLHI